jgi:hypothetical protein
MKISTVLTRARRSQAALALDPLPASKVQSDPPEIAEFDMHNSGEPTSAGKKSIRRPCKSRKSAWLVRKLRNWPRPNWADRYKIN